MTEVTPNLPHLGNFCKYCFMGTLLYRTLGFEPVITEREIKGYSINRVWRAVKRECLYLWANGYVTDVAEFDRGWMTEWHSNIGPFKMLSLIHI